MIKTVYGPSPPDAERIEDVELEQEVGVYEENMDERVDVMVPSSTNRKTEDLR